MTQRIISNQFRLTPRDSDFLDRKFGSRGEVYYDQDTNTLRLYDGDTQSGVSLAKNDLSNVSDTDFTTKLDAVGGGNQIPYAADDDLTWAAGEPASILDFGTQRPVCGLLQSHIQMMVNIMTGMRKPKPGLR